MEPLTTKLAIPPLIAGAISFFGAAADFPLTLTQFWLLAIPLSLLAGVYTTLDTSGNRKITWRIWAKTMTGSVTASCLAGFVCHHYWDLGWMSLVVAVFAGTSPQWVLSKVRETLAKDSRTNETGKH